MVCMSLIVTAYFCCAGEFIQYNALCFNFYACPVHLPFRFLHLTHQNLSVLALFCLNSLAKINMQLLILNNTCSTFFPLTSEMHWSGIYTSSKPNTNTPSDPKKQRLESSDQEYCLLAVVMKSSDVVLWKFDLPVTQCTR